MYEFKTKGGRKYNKLQCFLKSSEILKEMEFVSRVITITATRNGFNMSSEDIGRFLRQLINVNQLSDKDLGKLSAKLKDDIEFGNTSLLRFTYKTFRLDVNVI